MAEGMNVDFLGQIPIDPKICEYSDKGISFIIENPDSESSKIFMEIARKIKNIVENKKNKKE